MFASVTTRIHQHLCGFLGRRLTKVPLTSCPTRLLGNDAYGTWAVCPERIRPGSVVYSFGVGEGISWDLAMIEAFGVRVHAFDPTPRSALFVKRQALPEQVVFHDCGLADYDGVARFFPPENEEWVSHTLLPSPSTAVRAIEVPVRRPMSIMAELGHERVALIKMDIEEAEYAVVEDMVQDETPAGGGEQILIEFHHRFPGKNVKDTKTSLAALARCGFRPFHVSASGEEWSFLRG